MISTIKRVLLPVLALALVLSLAACAKTPTPVSTAEPTNEPAPTAESAPTAEPEPTTEPSPEPAGRQPGERFEETIIVEGMEETVKYEHVRSDALGFELDYDYERFERRTEDGREVFVSVWDSADDPCNYLELTRSADSARAAADALIAELSDKFDVLTHDAELEGAGECIYVEAAVDKDGSMPDRFSCYYIVPAGDGCLVATEHFAAEASEGFGRRFGYMLNTLTVLG